MLIDIKFWCEGTRQEISCYKCLAEISEKSQPIFNYQQMLIVSPGPGGRGPGTTSDIASHQVSQDQVVTSLLVPGQDLCITFVFFL